MLRTSVIELDVRNEEEEAAEQGPRYSIKGNITETASVVFLDKALALCFGAIARPL